MGWEFVYEVFWLDLGNCILVLDVVRVDFGVEVFCGIVVVDFVIDLSKIINGGFVVVFLVGIEVFLV